MDKLIKQINYFEENISLLSKDYDGTIIVISNDLKVDAFNTLNEAYQYGIEHYGLGNFLMRECRESIINEVHFITPNIVLA